MVFVAEWNGFIS